MMNRHSYELFGLLQRRYVHPIFGNHLLSCLFVRGVQKGKHDVAFDLILIDKGTDVEQLSNASSPCLSRSVHVLFFPI